MMQWFFTRQKQRFCLMVVFAGLIIVAVWNLTSAINYGWKKPQIHKYNNRDALSGFIKSRTVQRSKVENLKSAEVQRKLYLPVDVQSLINKVKHLPKCVDVAADPKSYWRSQFNNGSLDTSEIDLARMAKAVMCGILEPEFFSISPVNTTYPFENFYLSEPPLLNITDAADERKSIITLCNSSLKFEVGDTVAFKIQMKDGNGRPKTKGGDQIRTWFEGSKNKTKMAAMVTDLNNGTYLASAPLPWAGKLRLHVALAYPREYLRAVLYLHRVLKSFRLIAAVYNDTLATEATPCYHTQVIPGFNPSELCNLTSVNGSPWFCGRPIKSQLNCSHFTGTFVIGGSINYPVTDSEMETLKRSCSNSSAAPTLACNQVPPKDTWTQKVPTGYFSNGTWHSLSCQLTKPDYSSCFKNKEIVTLGDSNGRSHYHSVRMLSGCKEIKKALTAKWHKPLLCVHKRNNFTVRWEPHANPFINGRELATLDSLVPTARAIDRIPSKGNYLIILNHFFHLTTAHISSIDVMFRSIKDALVRLFKRNPNVQVVLQGPHISWHGWEENYAAGDMLGPYIMELQMEIFDEIKDKVVFISAWDMTIAVKNMNFHPSVHGSIFGSIVGFMCGR